MKDRIKKLRKELDLTQQKFGEHIGVKGNTIAQYEIGRNEPIDAVLSLICTTDWNGKYVNENWLRTGEGDMFIKPSRNEEMARLTKMLLNEEEDSFKNRLISVLANLTEEQWELLAEISEKLSNEKG